MSLNDRVISKNKKSKGFTMKAKWCAALLLLSICPAYCDINGNTAMQKFLKTMFSITVFAGIILIASGAASLIRTIVSIRHFFNYE